MPADGTVDAHHHVWDLSVWDLSVRDQPRIAGPSMLPLRRNFGLADLAVPAHAAGVTGTVVVQTVPVTAETPELLALAAGSDLVAGVVGWVDLTDPAVGERLAQLREEPGGAHLVGIRHLVQEEADPDWLGRGDVRRGLRAVAAAGLAYDLLVRPRQLAAAVAAAQALPELRFVLDHLAKPPVATGGARTATSR